MARKSHNKRHKGRGRGRHGGALPPLQSGAYPDVEMSGSNWNNSGFKSFIQQVTGGSSGAAASAAMNRYAMEGAGQSGSQSGGGSRRRRKSKIGTRRRRGGATTMPPAGAPAAPMMKPAPPAAPAAPAAPAPPAAPAAPAPAVGGKSAGMKGGMFATFGALLKEALVPLGLLAAQQAYGKTYGKKRHSSGSHTRKHRR